MRSTLGDRRGRGKGGLLARSRWRVGYTVRRCRLSARRHAPSPSLLALPRGRLCRPELLPPRRTGLIELRRAGGSGLLGRPYCRRFLLGRPCGRRFLRCLSCHSAITSTCGPRPLSKVHRPKSRIRARALAPHDRVQTRPQRTNRTLRNTRSRCGSSPDGSHRTGCACLSADWRSAICLTRATAAAPARRRLRRRPRRSAWFPSRCATRRRR